MRVFAELHCHTRFSDGAAEPEACARAAARRGLGILAITDHNTAEGALPYWQRPCRQGVLVVPGEEVSTDRGHLLVFFVRETIPPGPFEVVLEQARRQGALAFMAHPYHIPLGNRWRRRPVFRLTPAQLSRLDGIEVENGHNRARANACARALAEKEPVRAISGSDAHHTWEIGNARTVFELQDLSLGAVRESLCNGAVTALPRRWNALPVYYWVGLLNRLAGKQYAWKERH